MRITVREAATLLHAPESKVYAWIESGDLPAHRIADQYRINPSELLEWATTRNLPIDPTLFEEDDEAERIPMIAECLERGGVFHDVPGATRDDALSAVIDRLRLEDEGDREALRDLLLAREDAAVVPVGDGIAIPHVRSPIALAVDEPSVALCFLSTPVDFGAPDGKPVFALFFLVSPTTRVHLQMLSRIAYLLRHPTFRDAVRDRTDAERLVATARDLEEVR